MSSLNITFFPAPEGMSDADHYRTCFEQASSVLSSVGTIAEQYPHHLSLRLECPTELVKDIVQFLTVQNRLGIAKVIAFEPVHHREMGSDGG